MPPTQKKQKVVVKKEYEAETDDEKEKEEHDDQKQKVAMKKEYEAETDDEKEKEEHDNQKQKVAMKKEYEAETDDEEDKTSKRKKDLDAGKRKKVTYVWHLCKEHPNEDWRPSHEGGVLLILTKESYELWHKILLNLKNCQTWSDVRDLGDDVYAEVLDRGKYIWEYSEEDEKKREQDFSPNDSDEFNMIQVDVLYDSGSYDDIDMQNQSFPNDISKLMFDDLESTFLCKYNKFSSSFPWNSDHFNFDPKDADSLLEEITQRGDSIMHQPGLEDFMWHGLQAIS